MLSCLLVGLLSALAAIVLKFFVHTIGTWVSVYSASYEAFYLFALFPLVGISLTVAYVKFGLKGRLRKGSAEIGYALARHSAKLPFSQTYSHIVTSALTVGFGGSVGLESPMVSTGSAVGANYGTYFRLSYKDRTILVASGAAAGIAAAFNAPIAGVLFAIEVLLADVAVSAFIPIILAAATGALLSKIILAEGVILSFAGQQPFNYHNLPFYVLLGIIAGFVSLYYAHALQRMESLFGRLKTSGGKVLWGGLGLFVLLLAFPSLFGEGYESIKSLSSQDLQKIVHGSLLEQHLQSEISVLLFVGALIFIKVLAVGLTLGSGGNGGNFGPSLFVGAYLGFTVAKLINLTGIGHVPENNFTLVAMAGILSGVFYAPLCGIFLIAEITGGYALIIPLMIVAALSMTVAKYFEPLSMEGKKLETLLNATLENRDQLLLSKLDLSSLLETDFSAVRPDDTLKMLVRVVSISKRNTFPVVNREGMLMGVVYLDDIREIIFDTQRYDTTFVSELMSKAPAVQFNERLTSIITAFDETGQWNLPVVNRGKYLGFLSKARILTEYRAELMKNDLG